jgi:hypothetical protein
MNIFMGNKHRSKWILCGLFIVLILITLLGKLNSQQGLKSLMLNSSMKSEQVVMMTESPSNLEDKNLQPDKNERQVVNSFAPVYGKFSGTKAQMDELNQWRFERGYLPPDADKEQNAYNSYTEEALRALAKDGDIAALHVLADRYGDIDYIKANGIDILTVARISDDFLTQAAIRGSTRALMEISVQYEAEYASKAVSPQEKKAAEIEKLAIRKVAYFRGDPDSYLSGLKVAKSVDGVDITDDDKERIDLRAKEIYSQLQEKRKNLGLDDFDNSVPEVVRDFYESIYGKSY